ncbi:hypothetical protein [Chitinivibrio alkaliphilus]|uniref:Outer membrane protein beta-barrel domain-containing protein n=1 Tax=Chitinivibrio alkaliphilus ACht1 TaxID=1313304 RepID=U7D887_9BACT|nr:hypothetical protein [Chitinivibrio alkaliphilus]ERP39170.1 hypothetical protein CALK_0340 [Chitinivibrio alkaliphilus ACht1]
MKKTVFILLMVSVPLWAARTISLSIGPQWPGNNPLIKESESGTAWNASVEWGMGFDDFIRLGVKGDFMWHISSNPGIDDDDEDEPDTDDGVLEGISEIKSEQKIFMFPLSLFLEISPFPQYRFHPVFRGQVGYNSMTIRHTDYNDEEESEWADLIDDVGGYYNGVITKFGVDGVYDIGPQSSLFVGFEYQVATLKNDYEIDMNAPSIRMGISVYY